MSYYEYKYKIGLSRLNAVIDMFDSLYSGTDPYPSGCVNSVYYDTLDIRHYHTCRDGNSEKKKFRIRWYEGDIKIQGQLKEKSILQVRKWKHTFSGIGTDASYLFNVLWHQLFDKEVHDSDVLRMYHDGVGAGIMWPLVRVSYQRRRYRTYDYRFNIDSNIVAEAVPGHPVGLTGVVRVPFAVLEIKTMQERPYLPFMGDLRTGQISMSKFALGIQLLFHEVGVLNKYVMF